MGCVESRGEANFLLHSHKRIRKVFLTQAPVRRQEDIQRERERSSNSASLKKKKVIIIVKRVRAKGNEEFELYVVSVNSWQDLEDGNDHSRTAITAIS